MRMCLSTPLSRFIWRQGSCHCQHRWQSRKLDCITHYYKFVGLSSTVGSLDVVHIKWANCPAGDHYRMKGREGYPTLGFQCITNYNRLILGIFGPVFRAQNDKETVKLDQHVKNSLTAKSCCGGEKHRNPVGFYSRNGMESTLHHKHNNHKHHYHGGSVCPSYGVGYMDTPDRTRVTSSKGVGRGGGGSDITKFIDC